MKREGHDAYVRWASDDILRTALEAAFVSLGAVLGSEAADELLRVEHTILASVRNLAPPDALADATLEAAIHAVTIIREAFDNAHQRLGSAAPLEALCLHCAA